MDFDLIGIQETIGYSFSNPDLLKQAFIRTSYSEDNGGPDNQVLEFIGDKALDLAIVRLLTLTYGKVEDADGFKGYRLEHKEYYKSKFKEGDFSIIKQELVKGKFLSHCISNLGLHRYLLCGKSDENNSIEEKEKAKEDLFEAILGAVALDCDWYMPTICYVANVMMDIDSYIFHRDTEEDKYLEIIQEWSVKNGYGLPIYKYGYNGHGIFTCDLTFFNNSNLKFNGTGNDEASSRRSVAKNAYFDLLKSGKIVNQYRDAVGDPDLEKSLEQINVLVTKKMIDMPDFKCSSQYDKNGNETWNCILSAPNCEWKYEVYYVLSKTEARKNCAYNYLCYLMDEFGDWKDQ